MKYADNGFTHEAIGVCRELTEEELAIIAGGGSVGGAVIGGLQGAVVGGIGGIGGMVSGGICGAVAGSSRGVGA